VAGYKENVESERRAKLFHRQRVCNGQEQLGVVSIMNSKHDYTITQRSRKRRARLKLEKAAAQLIADQEAAAAQRLAADQQRTELAAKRAEQGLPPAMTSSERSRKTRERQRIAKEAADAEANKPVPVESIPNLVL
jgi:hypothetical protein